MRLVIYLRAGLGISTSHHRRRCLPAGDIDALSETIHGFVHEPRFLVPRPLFRKNKNNSKPFSIFRLES